MRHRSCELFSARRKLRWLTSACCRPAENKSSSFHVVTPQGLQELLTAAKAESANEELVLQASKLEPRNGLRQLEQISVVSKSRRG